MVAADEFHFGVVCEDPPSGEAGIGHSDRISGQIPPTPFEKHFFSLRILEFKGELRRNDLEIGMLIRHP